MDKIKCLVVDDEPLAQSLLEKHIMQMPTFDLVATCSNAMEAFTVLKENSIDLIFLDIQMPGLTGIEFAKSLNHRPSIIFTTAYRNYAIESYELDALDYLLKPISFQRFFKAVSKFQNLKTSHAAAESLNLKEAEQHYMFVNANKKNIKIEFDKILYIESLKDYVKIFLPDQLVMTKNTISDFEKKLPAHFLRVHRSFIINKKKITAFTKHDIEIGDKEIPIGGSYKEIVITNLNS